MSRNLRQKSFQALPARKSAKKLKYAEDTSDDDYSGVDLVSDSEDDEADVRAAEEAAIIESEFEDDDNESAATPRPVHDADVEADEDDDDHSSWGGFDLESEGHAHSVAGTPGPTQFFADAVADDQLAESAEVAVAENETTPNVRRVHFEYSESSSEDSDIADDVFPDIFLEQDRLDPRFRREIENDRSRDNLDNVSDDGSFWDFAGDNNGVSLNHPTVNESEPESIDESSSTEYDCKCVVS